MSDPIIIIIICHTLALSEHIMNLSKPSVGIIMLPPMSTALSVSPLLVSSSCVDGWIYVRRVEEKDFHATTITVASVTHYSHPGKLTRT